MTAIEDMQKEVTKLRAIQAEMIDDTGTVYPGHRYEYQTVERTIQSYLGAIKTLNNIKEGATHV